MGLFFFKPYKEKIANKLYDCFFEKENLIYTFKTDKDSKDEFTIIVSSSGIFLFSIYKNEGEIASFFKKKDEFLKIDDLNNGYISISNPYFNLIEVQDFIISNLKDKTDINLKFYLIPIFDNLKKLKENDEVYSIKTFKKFLKNISQIYNNREVDELTNLVKEINTYECAENA